MFTNSFKILIGLVVLVVILAAVSLSQFALVHRVTLLEERPASVIKEQVTVTQTPTATPTAVLKYVPATRSAPVSPAVK